MTGQRLCSLVPTKIVLFLKILFINLVEVSVLLYLAWWTLNSQLMELFFDSFDRKFEAHVLLIYFTRFIVNKNQEKHIFSLYLTKRCLRDFRVANSVVSNHILGSETDTSLMSIQRVKVINSKGFHAANKLSICGKKCSRGEG